MNDSLASTAIALASAGVPNFPCEPHGKAPLTSHGYLDATTDPALTCARWERCPQANIGMPTGSQTFDVLDVDVRKNGSGMETLEYLKPTGLLSGAVRLVQTPSGGLHLYFVGTEQPCASLPSLFVDFKGVGGYVLVPPSSVATVHRSGTYVELDRRENGRPLDWCAVRRLLCPPPIPYRGATSGMSLRTLARWLKSQPEGTRNQSLYWAACRALENGHTNLDDLVEAAEITGLPLDEINRTVASALAHTRGVAS